MEGDQIVGYMLEKAKAAGVVHELHELASIHLKCYEMRRASGR